MSLTTEGRWGRQDRHAVPSAAREPHGIATRIGGRHLASSDGRAMTKGNTSPPWGKRLAADRARATLLALREARSAPAL